MRTVFLATLPSLVAGCVATSEPVMAPDGSQGWYVQCPRSQRKCLDEAAGRCPNGYYVLGTENNSRAIAQTNYQTGQTIITPIYRGAMTIQCRQPPPPSLSPITRTAPPY